MSRRVKATTLALDAWHEACAEKGLSPTQEDVDVRLHQGFGRAESWWILRASPTIVEEGGGLRSTALFLALAENDLQLMVVWWRAFCGNKNTAIYDDLDKRMYPAVVEANLGQIWHPNSTRLLPPTLFQDEELRRRMRQGHCLLPLKDIKQAMRDVLQCRKEVLEKYRPVVESPKGLYPNLNRYDSEVN